MRAGDLNRRITFQHPTKAPDGMGALVVTWTDAATVWAAIWPVSAKETVEAMQTGMTITHRIRIRYRSVMKAAWRIKYGDKFYNIVSIIDQNMAHKTLDIMCKETT